MNKQLSNKFKKEFDHFLEGGTLLVRDLDTPNKVWGQVYADDGILFTHTNNYQFVINDKYVEFRKALCEGTTVQVINIHSQHIFDPNQYDDIPTDWIFEGDLTRYRIKPEHKLEIGDWFHTVSKSHIAAGLHKVTPETIKLYETYLAIKKGRHVFSYSELVKWLPTEGELCVFWDNDSDTYTIAPFVKTEVVESHTVYCTANEAFHNVAPLTFDISVYHA